MTHCFPDKPVCSEPSRRTQSLVRLESSRVLCEVEAFPPVVNFTWKFNGSSEAESLPVKNIQTQGTVSVLNYTAVEDRDYGNLLITF